MTDQQEQPLQPATFQPRAPMAADGPEPGPARPRWLVPASIAVLAASIGVFFLLPTLIEPATPTPGGQTAAGDRPNGGVPMGAKPEGEGPSPFAEAQLQKQRRAAQEALQALLTLQEALVDRGVEHWASARYTSAVDTAGQGDLAYRERRFDEATGAYRSAHSELTAIEASIPERVARDIETALAAIESGVLAEATAAVERLGMIAPEHPDLTGLEARTKAVPAVQSALEQAARAASAQRYSEAVTHAETALKADPQHTAAAERLARYRQGAIDNRFRQAMSDGYAALESRAFDDAKRAFARAAELRPGAPEPRTAQSELTTARNAHELRTLQARGRAQESAEQWSEAVATYEAALAIDRTVVFARSGLERAGPRSELAAALEEILTNTDRLSDPRVLQEARNTLAEARSTPDPGPVLTGRIDRVAAALDHAQTPVDVSLVSDGNTDVTVLRVKRLGTFTETALTLRPGTYTALGVRTGYRDVRVDFEVRPGESPAVQVVCEETI